MIDLRKVIIYLFAHYFVGLTGKKCNLNFIFSNKADNMIRMYPLLLCLVRVDLELVQLTINIRPKMII